QPRVPASVPGRAQLPPDYLSFCHSSGLQACDADERVRAQPLPLLRRCWATSPGNPRNENIDRQAIRPSTMKPQKVSTGSRWSAPRKFMLRFSTSAAPPTPRLMASGCIMDEKLLARLISREPRSAEVRVLTAVNCRDRESPPITNTPIMIQIGVWALNRPQTMTSTPAITAFTTSTRLNPKREMTGVATSFINNAPAALLNVIMPALKADMPK